MRNILTATVKFTAIVFCGLSLTITSFSQITLRNAVSTDGDNKADHSVFRQSNNTWYIRRSVDGVLTAQTFGLATDDFLTPGDYDGDGKGDISVWRDTNGVWYRLNSIGNTFTAVLFGVTGDTPVARDYDGDGKTDIAVVRRTGGNMIWYYLRSIDGGFVAAQFGLATDFTAPGDYDGDGKFDFAVQRPGSPTFFYIQRTTAGFLAVQWGFGNDLVVPGDYDGDGKTDVAVVREGSLPTDPLTWYALRSSDGGLLAVSFGATGTDLSAQNDYDGDNKTDIAVWRDSNGTFYVRSSLTGNMNVTPWGLPNDVPVASYDTH